MGPLCTLNDEALSAIRAARSTAQVWLWVFAYSLSMVLELQSVAFVRITRCSMPHPLAIRSFFQNISCSYSQE